MPGSAVIVTIYEEFYSFRTNPRPDVQVLTIDERTYLPDPNTTNTPIDAEDNYNPTWIPGKTGYMSGCRGVPGDHPMSRTHTNLGGTVFYTALGHQPGLYSNRLVPAAPPRRHPLDPDTMIASSQPSCRLPQRAGSTGWGGGLASSPHVTPEGVKLADILLDIGSEVTVEFSAGRSSARSPATFWATRSRVG